MSISVSLYSFTLQAACQGHAACRVRVVAAKLTIYSYSVFHIVYLVLTIFHFISVPVLWRDDVPELLPHIHPDSDP